MHKPELRDVALGYAIGRSEGTGPSPAGPPPDNDSFLGCALFPGAMGAVILIIFGWATPQPQWQEYTAITTPCWIAVVVTVAVVGYTTITHELFWSRVRREQQAKARAELEAQAKKAWLEARSAKRNAPDGLGRPHDDAQEAVVGVACETVEDILGRSRAWFTTRLGFYDPFFHVAVRYVSVWPEIDGAKLREAFPIDMFRAVRLENCLVGCGILGRIPEVSGRYTVNLPYREVGPYLESLTTSLVTPQCPPP